MRYKVIVDSCATEEYSGAYFYFDTLEKLTDFIKICVESASERYLKIVKLGE